MTPIHQSILQCLGVSPRLSFAAVMELALYDPTFGYYGPGPRRIGRQGDFFTAVSVGPLYGQLLAELARQTHDRLARPAAFCVIEQAAHDGQLAADILSTCDFDYVIVEPNPRYEVVQRARLTGFEGRVSWVPSLAETPARPALFLCNELPDAMPVHLVQWDGFEWQELFVERCSQTSSLVFRSGPPSSSLTDEIVRLPRELPLGYTTEIGLAALDWMRDLASAPFYGAIYVADYGLDHEDLYAPERTKGTLRRYRQHQTDDLVLEDLGDCDLTTHVNFTRLIEVAELSGLKLRSYEHQGRYLSKLGIPWLASLDGIPQNAGVKVALRQFQSLTHPAMMGRSFRVVVLEK